MYMDGNLAALDLYEDQYARQMDAFEAHDSALELEAETVIGYLMQDRDYEGRECHCCGNKIHGFGKIKAYWEPWADADEIEYLYYCEECSKGMDI